MLLLLVAHAEKGRLEHEHAAVGDELLIEAHEEGDEEVADVEAVHVGIGGEDDLAVAEALHGVLHVERLDEVVELLVAVEHVAVLAAGVERLAAEAEHGLLHGVARGAERAAGGLALGEEDHRVLAPALLVALLVEAQVLLAVLELRHAHGDGGGALAALLLDRVELAAELRGLLDLGDELVRLGGGAVEHLLDGLLHLRHELAAELAVAEFRLRLPVEHGILHADRDAAEEALAHVVAVELLLGVVVVDRLGERLLEGGEVGAALGGVLSVDERVVLLGEAVRVGEDDLHHLRAVVERLVELLELRLVGDEVGEAGGGLDLLAVEVDREAGVHVAVHLHAALDVLFPHLELAEDVRVRHVAHVGAVPHARLLALPALLGDELPLAEERLGELALAERAHLELAREGVHGLRAHAVHAGGELEGVGVELAAGVHLAHALDHLAERDAAAVVAHGRLAGLEVDGHVDLPPEAHHELVHGVVDHLLHEDVDAVVVAAAVADVPDVHAGALADVLDPVEGRDVLVVVV